MKKDIFIDNNIAKNFTNPLDSEYKKLILWLKEYDPLNSEMCAHLVVSQKLLVEYGRSAMNASSPTCMPVIIDILQREGRLIRISNEMIKEFQKEYFTKTIYRKLESNTEDQNHIPVVLLSHRKFALSIDENFIRDLEKFPGFRVTIAKRPEHLSYKS